MQHTEALFPSKDRTAWTEKRGGEAGGPTTLCLRHYRGFSSSGVLGTLGLVSFYSLMFLWVLRNTHTEITYTDEKLSKDTPEHRLEEGLRTLGKNSMNTERSQLLVPPLGCLSIPRNTQQRHTLTPMFQIN